MDKEFLSKFEENTLRIFKDSISAIKEAGKEELAQKWKTIVDNCSRKVSPQRKEKSPKGS
jgi:hypothetical protein